MVIQNYKDLIVWQKAVDLSVLIYKITEKFPKSELFGLMNQMRRCSVSIPSNIAEGTGRKLNSQDQRQFLRIAYGSAQELETQLIIANKLGYISNNGSEQIHALLTEILKMLNVMIRKH